MICEDWKLYHFSDWSFRGITSKKKNPAPLNIDSIYSSAFNSRWNLWCIYFPTTNIPQIYHKFHMSLKDCIEELDLWSHTCSAFIDVWMFVPFSQLNWLWSHFSFFYFLSLFLFLSLSAPQAEARLAAKRAARAEAREIRMKELERQQKEVQVKIHPHI